MAKVVEPPVLMSRILAFLLATSVVVMGTLVVTLVKMIPLERPEVFFLSTPTRSTNVYIEPLVPDSANNVALEKYKEGFIREYIIARNELYPMANMTRSNWLKIVKPWSSEKVFKTFTETSLYQAYVMNDQSPLVLCKVDFSNLLGIDENTYNVNFTWTCEKINGQAQQKNYKIQIKIESDLDKKMSGTLDNLDKLNENPLGIQVVGYKVLDGKGDPLDSDTMSW